MSAELKANSKNLKKMQKEFQKKKEQFYIKKRGLFRKAEQVAKHCNTDIFIVAYNNDTNNLFTFQSDAKFNLEKISELILKDVQNGSLFRNQKFIDEDFEKVKTNVKQMKAEQGHSVIMQKGKVVENDSDDGTVEELSMPMVNGANF